MPDNTEQQEVIATIARIFGVSKHSKQMNKVRELLSGLTVERETAAFIRGRIHERCEQNYGITDLEEELKALDSGTSREDDAS